MPPKHKGFNMRTKSGSSANPHRSTDGVRQNGSSLRDKVSCCYELLVGAVPTYESVSYISIISTYS